MPGTPKYKATPELLSDFAATIDAKPNLSEAEIFAKFPEFNNDKNFLQSAVDYYATSKSGKYKDVSELNSKFPEFDFTQKKSLDGTIPANGQPFGQKVSKVSDPPVSGAPNTSTSALPSPSVTFPTTIAEGAAKIEQPEVAEIKPLKEFKVKPSSGIPDFIAPPPRDRTHVEPDFIEAASNQFMGTTAKLASAMLDINHTFTPMLERIGVSPKLIQATKTFLAGAMPLNLFEPQVHEAAQGLTKISKTFLGGEQEKLMSQSPVELIKNGNYGKAAKVLGAGIAGFLPYVAALETLPAAAAVPIFTSEAKQEADQNPELTEDQRMKIALGHGLVMGVIMPLGGSILTAPFKQIAIKEGLTAAKEGLAKTIYTGALQAVKSSHPLSVGMRSALTGMSMQFANNFIDKEFDPTKKDLDLSMGVLDAGLQFGLMGLGTGVAGKVYQGLGTAKGREAAKVAEEKADNIQKDLQNPDLPPEAKQIIAEQLPKVIGEVNEEVVKENDANKNLTEEQSNIIAENTQKKNVVEAALENPALTDEGKSALEASKKEAEKQIEDAYATSKDKVAEPLISEPIVKDNAGNLTKEVAENESPVKYDRSGNPIGDGSFHSDYNVLEFKKYPQIESSVSKAEGTESVYVIYFNPNNDKRITVRFSHHDNNAVKFGDQLNGNRATENEILYHLGLKERTFIPDTRLFIDTRKVAKKDLDKYEEADKTIKELYALGKDADVSKYIGKLAKDSNYLILGDRVTEQKEATQNALGQTVYKGQYEYNDIPKNQSELSPNKKEVTNDSTDREQQIQSGVGIRKEPEPPESDQSSSDTQAQSGRILQTSPEEEKLIHEEHDKLEGEIKSVAKDKGIELSQTDVEDVATIHLLHQEHDNPLTIEESILLHQADKEAIENHIKASPEADKEGVNNQSNGKTKNGQTEEAQKVEVSGAPAVGEDAAAVPENFTNKAKVFADLKKIEELKSKKLGSQKNEAKIAEIEKSFDKNSDEYKQAVEQLKEDKLQSAKDELKAAWNDLKNIGITFDPRANDKKTLRVMKAVANLIKEGVIKTIDDLKAFFKNEFEHELSDEDAEHIFEPATGIKNATTKAEREARGLSEVEIAIKKSAPTIFEEVKDKVDRGKLGIREETQLLAESNANPTTEQAVALVYDRMRLQNEHRAIMESIEEADKEGDKDKALRERIRLGAIEEAINLNDIAAKKTGRDWGLTGQARQLMIKQDYSLAALIQKAKVANGSKELSAEARKQIEELSKKLEEANEKIVEYEKNKAKKASEEDMGSVTVSVAKAKKRLSSSELQVKQEALLRQAKEILKRNKEKMLDEILPEIINEDLTPRNPDLIPRELIPVLKQLQEIHIQDALDKGEKVDAENLIESIYQELGGNKNDFTHEDLRDAISGYGRISQLSKDEINVAIRKINKELRDISALEFIEAGERPLKSGFQKPEYTKEELARAKVIRQKLREKGLMNKGKERSPEEQYATALDAQKTRLTNKKSELQEILEKGKTDPSVFAKKKRTPLELDERAQSLSNDVLRLKNKVDQEIEKLRLANRTNTEKFLDTVVKTKRFAILLGVKVLGKLATAGVEQSLIFTPLRKTIQGGLAKIPGISKIAAKAPSEGVFSPKAIAINYATWLKKETYKEVGRKLKTGKSNIDLQNAKERVEVNDWTSFVNNVHGAIKELPKQAEYWSSLQQIAEYEIRNGNDITDPKVMAKMHALAYDNAVRNIFMNKNFATDIYRTVLARLKQSGTGGKIVASVIQFDLPIVNVPTNIINDVYSYVAGSLKAAWTLRGGVDKLTERQADHVMRSLGKQSVGLIGMGIAYSLYKSFGGFYQKGENDKELKPGEINTGNVKISKAFLHHPGIYAMMISADIEQQYQDALQTKKPFILSDAILKTVASVGSEVPFLEEPARISKNLKDTHSIGLFIGQSLAGLTEPQVIQEIAKYLDKNPLTDEQIKRAPQGIIDVMKMGIPGLRQQVPTSEEVKFQKVSEERLKDKPRETKEEKLQKKEEDRKFEEELQLYDEKHGIEYKHK